MSGQQRVQHVTGSCGFRKLLTLFVAVTVIITAGSCSKGSNVASQQATPSTASVATTTATTVGDAVLWEDDYVDANKLKWHVRLTASPGHVLETSWKCAGAVPGDKILYTVQLEAVNKSDRTAQLPNFSTSAKWSSDGKAGQSSDALWNDEQYCGKFEAVVGGSGNYTKVPVGSSVKKKGWVMVPSPLPSDLSLVAPDGKTPITSLPPS